jgi:hypothetical protein
MRLRQGFLPGWALVFSIGAYSIASLAQVPASISADPLFGTWVLDKAKSRYFDGQPLREQIRIFEPHDEGVKAKVVTIDHAGTATVTEYVAAYDGVEHPFSGAASADAVILTRESRYVGVTSFRHGGIAAGDARREITPDGREMTVTIRVRGNITRITVFRKAN